VLCNKAIEKDGRTFSDASHGNEVLKLKWLPYRPAWGNYLKPRKDFLESHGIDWCSLTVCCKHIVRRIEKFGRFTPEIPRCLIPVVLYGSYGDPAEKKEAALVERVDIHSISRVNLPELIARSVV
jgi:hypothetical protein